MTFGLNVKKYRQQKRWSQSDLSKQTSIPQTTISDLENSKYLPNIQHAIKLANALDISITELLNNVEEARANDLN